MDATQSASRQASNRVSDTNFDITVGSASVAYFIGMPLSDIFGSIYILILSVIHGRTFSGQRGRRVNDVVEGSNPQEHRKSNVVGDGARGGAGRRAVCAVRHRGA